MTKPTPTDNTRLNQIALAIRNMAQQVMQPAQDIADRKDELDDLRSGVSSLREDLMLQLARLSEKDAWTKGEIDAAAKEAAKVNTNQADGKPTQGEKTMGVFISDLRQVANPKVCAHVGALLSMRDDAWGIEDEAYRSAPKEDRDTVARPCRKLWGRKYHMFMAMVRDTIDGKVDFWSTTDVIEHAVRMDPDLDATKVKARLEVIVNKLAEIYNDFKHDDIKVCMDYLGVLDVQALINVKINGTVVPAPVQEPQTPAPVVPALVQEPQTPSNVFSIDDLDSVLAHIAA